MLYSRRVSIVLRGGTIGYAKAKYSAFWGNGNIINVYAPIPVYSFLK